MRQKVLVCRSQVNKVVMQAQVSIYEFLQEGSHKVVVKRSRGKPN